MRKKTGRRRGRPVNPHARRRATTRRERRGLPEPIDKGTPQMAKRKAVAANGSSGPVELIDGIAVLYAHHLIDLDGLMVLRTIEVWLGRVRRARGLSGSGPGGLWAQIVAGQRGGRWVSPMIDAHRRTPGDMAWWRICQIHNHFAEVRQLETLALVMAVAAGDHRPADHVELVALHYGIHMVSELIRRGRPVQRNTAIATVQNIFKN